MYVKGIVLSSEARVFPKKNEPGHRVRVSHEIACQPGVVKWEEFIDPAEDDRVTMRGGELIGWPKWPDFSPIVLKFKRFSIFNNMLTISNVEVLG
jgi:hypothetical protein